MGRGRVIGPHRESGTSRLVSTFPQHQRFKQRYRCSGMEFMAVVPVEALYICKLQLFIQPKAFLVPFGTFWCFLVLSFESGLLLPSSHSMRKKCLVHGNNMIQCNLRSLMLPFLIQLIAVAPNIEQDSAIQRRQVVFTDRPMPFAFSHSCTLPPVTLS